MKTLVEEMESLEPSPVAYLSYLEILGDKIVDFAIMEEDMLIVVHSIRDGKPFIDLMAVDTYASVIRGVGKASVSFKIETARRKQISMYKRIDEILRTLLVSLLLGEPNLDEDVANLYDVMGRSYENPNEALMQLRNLAQRISNYIEE